VTARLREIQGGVPRYQHQEAEQELHQRRDEIAEAGRHHVAVDHGPDEDQPVRHHQQARHQQPHYRAQGQAQAPPERLAVPQQQETGQHGDGPQDSVRNDLDGRGRVDQLEVDRQQAPVEIAGQRRQRSRCGFAEGEEAPA
jgi:hypothetical protein